MYQFLFDNCILFSKNRCTWCVESWIHLTWYLCIGFCQTAIQNTRYPLANLRNHKFFSLTEQLVFPSVPCNRTAALPPVALPFMNNSLQPIPIVVNNHSNNVRLVLLQPKSTLMRTIVPPYGRQLIYWLTTKADSTLLVDPSVTSLFRQEDILT